MKWSDIAEIWRDSHNFVKITIPDYCL